MKRIAWVVLLLLLTSAHGWCMSGGTSTPSALHGVTVCSGEAGDVDPKSN